jgi:hypothetical protein
MGVRSWYHALNSVNSLNDAGHNEGRTVLSYSLNGAGHNEACTGLATRWKAHCLVGRPDCTGICQLELVSLDDWWRWIHCPLVLQTAAFYSLPARRAWADARRWLARQQVRVVLVTEKDRFYTPIVAPILLADWLGGRFMSYCPHVWLVVLSDLTSQRLHC